MLTDALTYVDLQDAGNAQSQLILMALARLGDWRTGVYIGPQETIAQIAKCDVRTLRRHLKRLERDGFVHAERLTRSNGTYSTNRVTLLGYAEWYTALRSGGSVARPKAAARYGDFGVDGPSKIAPDNLSSGGPANDAAANVFASDNLSERTGHLLSDLIGQQESEHISLRYQSKISSNTHPPTPRTAGGDEGEGCGKAVDGQGETSAPTVDDPQALTRRTMAAGWQVRSGGTETRRDGWHESWTRAARKQAAEIAESGTPEARALVAFLAVVRGLLAPPKGQDAAAFLRELHRQIALTGVTDEAAWREAGERMLEGRTHTLLSPRVIAGWAVAGAVSTAAHTAHKATVDAGRERAAAHGDGFAAGWDAFAAAIRRALPGRTNHLLSLQFEAVADHPSGVGRVLVVSVLGAPAKTVLAAPTQAAAFDRVARETLGAHGITACLVTARRIPATAA